MYYNQICIIIAINGDGLLPGMVLRLYTFHSLGDVNPNSLHCVSLTEAPNGGGSTTVWIVRIYTDTRDNGHNKNINVKILI